jgi:hypothetical protein
LVPDTFCFSAIEEGGFLYVTGTPKNKYAQPLSDFEAAAAGFQKVGEVRIIPSHQFGVQKSTNGAPLSSANSKTTIYQKTTIKKQ